ncbi:MAG: ABC-2 transporter permease [Oscillospiraceae bacterium]
MKGLLLKDFYVLTKQLKLFLFVIVAISLVPGYSMSAFAICYSAMLPITTLAYDEQCHWEKLVIMMPFSIKSIVLSKYVLGYIAVFFSAVLALLGKLGFALLTGKALSLSAAAELLPVVCVGILLLGLNLPFMFKLGVEKGRLVFLLTTCLVVVGGLFFYDRLKATLEPMNLNLGLIALLFITAALVLNAVSILASLHIYKKRCV